MSIDTPDWVRDAVFYQVFPDRFAALWARPDAGDAGSVGCAADDAWLQGGDLRWRFADRLLDLRGWACRPLPDARSSRRRRTIATTRTTTSRSIPLLGGDDGPARAARPGPCARDAGRPRRRLQPHRSWLLAVPPRRSRTAPRRRYRDWFHLDERCSMPRRPLHPRLPRRPARRPVGSAGTRAWWGTCRRCPSSTPAEPARARVPALGVAEHWLRFGIDGWRLDVAEEIDEPGLLAGVPAPLPRRRPRGLPRRRDLARGARVAGGRSLRRA